MSDRLTQSVTHPPHGDGTLMRKSSSDCPPRTRTAITGSKVQCPASEGAAARVVSSLARTASRCVGGGGGAPHTPIVTRNLTHDGLIRWVVFQRTPRARFRLTQWLFAADKRAAKAMADVWYAGCQGTLEVLSFVEFQMVLDDLDALHRTRVAPAEPGQRRPHMKRGISFGACVWCGAITSARGGRAPKYCATHRERKFQRAYRTGAPVIGSIQRTLPAEYEAPRRQVVGA